MLSVHGRRITIPFALAIPVVGMIVALGSTVVGVLSSAFLAFHSGSLEASQMFNLGLGGILGTVSGVLGALHTGSELRGILFHGTLQHALVANSRTLAIVRFRAPTVYIKYPDCVAVKLYRSSVVLSDGREFPLECEGAYGKRIAREFIEPLYAWWWPQLDFEGVRKALHERVKGGEKFHRVSCPIFSEVKPDLECAHAEL